MPGDNTGRAGLALGGVALVTAAIALAQKRAQAASNGSFVTLDTETMELLIAMAQASADIEELLSVIAGTQPGQTTGQIILPGPGFPPSVDGTIATRVQVAALNTPYRLPDIAVPDGMILQLKGWPTNAGTLYVARSAAASMNINQVWPLLPNEAIGYQIKNANAKYVAAIGPPTGFGAAGDWLAITVEQKKGS